MEFAPEAGAAVDPRIEKCPGGLQRDAGAVEAHPKGGVPVELPEHMRPPYADESAIGDTERCRRAACRLFLFGATVTVPRHRKQAFDAIADRMSVELAALTPAERLELRRLARVARAAARNRLSGAPENGRNQPFQARRPAVK